MITRQNNGFDWVDFLKVDETEIDSYKPLAGSFTIVECEKKYLLCYNKWRQQWEIPAGKREYGETPLECAQRELYEETGQIASDMEFIGLAKICNNLNSQIKYNPIFFAKINHLQPFRENSETTDIRLWNLADDIHIDQVDLQILNFLNGKI
jgi:8-oxo-dGTP diphosphatase